MLLDGGRVVENLIVVSIIGWLGYTVYQSLTYKRKANISKLFK